MGLGLGLSHLLLLLGELTAGSMRVLIAERIRDLEFIVLEAEQLLAELTGS